MQKNFFRKINNFPIFYVIHSEIANQPTRKFSPFTVQKCLAKALRPGYKASKLASGDLLLELKDKEQHSNLAKLVAFGEIPITVSAHRSLNTVRGVISEIDFLTLTEDEILDGLKEQNVIHVHRIKIRKDGKELATKHLVLTFASTTLPESIQVGYVKVNVRHHIPNPRRCFNCQRYGHGSQSCRGRQTSGKCASTEHPSENCDAAPRCANCEGTTPRIRGRVRP